MNGQYLTVWVWSPRRGRKQAVCHCGWTGKLRWLKGIACHDAWDHSARNDHPPADPLVLVDDGILKELAA